MNSVPSAESLLERAMALGASVGSESLCQRSAKAHHMNSDGAFYVEDDICLICDLPHEIAPDLIGYEEKEGSPHHCFFKRQPATGDELMRATEALQGACCEGLRYCGKDIDTIKRIIGTWPEAYTQVDLLSREGK